MKAETVEARAVKIAAFIMHKAGLCRLEDPEDCKRVDLKGGGRMCERCIQSWLIRRANVELIREGKLKHGDRASD